MINKKYLTIKFFLLYIFLIMIFVTSILIYFHYKSGEREIKYNYIIELKNEYKIVLGVYEKLSNFINTFHIDKKEIKTIFAKGVESDQIDKKNSFREELYKKLLPLYNQIKKYNFRQLHFHEKNNRSYLRFHIPEKYGDDLTDIRESVKYVNKNRKYISGFEEGRIVNGYRYVYPLSLDKKHIGSVEISISMKTLINQFYKCFNKKAQFIIKKDIVKKKLFKSELSNYINWSVDSDYMLDKKIVIKDIFKTGIKKGDIEKIKDNLKENIKNKDPFIVEIEYNSKPVLVIFLPIINFKGDITAYVFRISDGKVLKNLKFGFYLIEFILFMLVFILIVFIIYYGKSQKKIEKLATFDTLTNTYVRGIIMGILDKEYERFKRYKTKFSIIMVDIDHFKRINDGYGHTAGDIVLTAVAQIMKKNIRKTDYIGRYGGEEFLIVLPETDQNSSIVVAEKLRVKISEYDFHRIKKVTISCGVSEVSEEINIIEDLINSADEKLYKAKKSGRDKVIG